MVHSVHRLILTTLPLACEFSSASINGEFWSPTHTHKHAHACSKLTLHWTSGIVRVDFSLGQLSLPEAERSLSSLAMLRKTKLLRDHMSTN